MEAITVRGAALVRDLAKVTIQGVPDQPGVAARIFHAIAAANVVVDDIIQNISRRGAADVSFTVAKDELATAMETSRQIAQELGAGETIADDKVSKVSVVGIGMRSHSGVAEKMFRALADEKINIQMISTSEIKISCVVDEERAADALRAVHQAFALDQGS